MSALGHKRTSEPISRMSAFPPKADMHQHTRDVRFVPKVDIGCSLNHLVSQLQKGFAYRETESFSSSEIDDELELVGRLRRQIPR